MATMIETWKSLMDWAFENAPHLLQALDPDIFDWRINAAKSGVGHEDSQLWGLYQLTGGNRPGGLTFPIPGLRILPPDELSIIVDMWRELSIEQDYANDVGGQAGVEVVQTGLVRDEYAYLDHVPFAADGAGNYLALDFAPGPLGTVGQVINIGVGEEKRYVVAKDLSGLFELLLTLLKDKSIAVNVYDKNKTLFASSPIVTYSWML